MSKKIDFSMASFVDLKAEVFRKQQDFAKRKSENIGLLGHRTFINNKKLPDKQKPKQDGSFINVKQSPDTFLSEEDKKLEQSRVRLIEKAAIYNKLSQGGTSEGLADDESRSLYLVDFERKAADSCSSDSESEQASTTVGERQVDSGRTKIKDSDRNGEFELDNDDDQEYVEFVDDFGRTRRCRREDLNGEKVTDSHLLSKQLSDNKKPEKSSDTCASEPSTSTEADTKKTAISVHYQHVSKDEIWDRGAGYYRFSSDEAERQQQMKRLNELRQQTQEKRKSVEQLKEKRKRLMEARLAKVRERKGLHDDFASSLNDEVQDVDLGEIELPEDLPPDAKKTKVDEDESKRRKHIRPWDIGKPKVLVSQDDWVEKQRKERYSEFAPPTTYYPS